MQLTIKKGKTPPHNTLIVVDDIFRVLESSHHIISDQRVGVVQATPVRREGFVTDLVQEVRVVYVLEVSAPLLSYLLLTQ